MTQMPDAVDLRVWVADLKCRGLSIVAKPEGHLRLVDGDGVVVGRKVETQTDAMMLVTWHWALRLAAAGEHATWWWAVLGAAKRPTMDEIPVSSHDPQRFACAMCGRPAYNLDRWLISRCQQHQVWG